VGLSAYAKDYILISDRPGGKLKVRWDEGGIINVSIFILVQRQFFYNLDESQGFSANITESYLVKLQSLVGDASDPIASIGNVFWLLSFLLLIAVYVAEPDGIVTTQ